MNINFYNEIRHDFTYPLNLQTLNFKPINKTFFSSKKLWKTKKTPTSYYKPFRGNSFKKGGGARVYTNPRRNRRLYWISKTNNFTTQPAVSYYGTSTNYNLDDTLSYSLKSTKGKTLLPLQRGAYRFPSWFSNQSFINFGYSVDLPYQIYNRVVRFSLISGRISRDVVNTSTSLESQLVAFWKMKYPHSLRVVSLENEPLFLKKTSKINRPVKPLFFKFRSIAKDFHLLNKTFITQRSTRRSVSLLGELALVKPLRLNLQKSLTKLNLAHLSSLYLFLHFGVSNRLVNQVYTTSSLDSSIFWRLSFKNFQWLNYYDFNETAFFFKNLDLLKASWFNSRNVYKFSSIKNFFMTNRQSFFLKENTKSRNNHIFQTVVRGGGFKSARVLPPHLRTRLTLPLFRNYYMFIEFSKMFNRWSYKRPIYSHFFSNKFLHTKYLITITDNFKVIPFWRYLSISYSFPSFHSKRGLVNTFSLKSNDNFLETYYDLQILTFLKKATTSSFYLNKGKLNSRLLSYCAETTLQPNVKESSRVNNTLITVRGPGSFNLNYLPYSFESLRQKTFLLQNPLLFKFLFWNHSTISQLLLITPLLMRFGVKTKTLNSIYPVLWSNLIPLSTFNYTVKRKIIKMVVNNKYLPRTTLYFYKTLVNFIEFYTGKRVYLKFNPFIENSLTYSDLARCYMWFGRVNPYQRILGHRIFVHESLRIFHLALRFKDPTFLSNWIKAMLYRMSFWKYRILFRYIKYVLRTLFISHFEDLHFKGLKLVLRGKISVAGNARTRTLAFSIGKTSHSEMDNRILSSFTTIHSFTGVMGFRLSFYF